MSPIPAARGPLRLVVGAAGTGSGKTLVAMALCRVFRDAGLRVRAYKAGPDYIDARLYADVLGAPAHNLDLWLDGADGVRRHVAATVGDADVLVIEGMMGLFDGDDAGETSTAEIARVLDADVVSVIDTWTSSQSAAAVALGLRIFDPEVRHLGVVLNRIGGPGHDRAVRAACARAGIEVLAAVPYRDDCVVPERLLGVDRRSSGSLGVAVERIAETLAAALDVPALMRAARSGEAGGDLPAPVAAPTGATIAYANDDAFWFTYPETLDALRLAGAELVPFSPLHDRGLPSGAGGVWIGGGYPEDVARDLSANASMRHSVRAAVADGLAVYAECGGLMYLAETLHTADGAFAMAGALAGATSIAEPRLHLGYREGIVSTGSVLDEAGSVVRAYEFHYATSQLSPATSPAYAYDGRSDGAVRERCLGTFLHRHFLPGDRSIGRFVAAAAAR